jgi:aminomuconate-semialdehyde/2-hydroxymuconate-6-semialdehyde dehydrogenase
MQIENFIAGEHKKPASGQYMDNINPSTGAIYGRIPLSGEVDIDDAVGAAKEAFTDWKKAGTSTYSYYLNKIAEYIEDSKEMLAEAESIDNGKPLNFARTVDIPRAAENFRFFAQAATQFASESHPMPNKAINYTLRQALGPVACISPWNLPMYLLSWKIAPALACGNTVVAKPSEVTPATAYLLGKIIEKVGLPKGVLNIVHGTGPQTGTPLVNHPEIKAVSFTGGTSTGATIASQIAPKFKKMSLELGGKNATIIFADCDYEAMLSNTVRAAFSNQGQICLCGSRILVQKSIYDRFLKDFIEKTKNLRLGDPLEEKTQIGAVVSEAHMHKILQFIDWAKEEGGTIALGGKRFIPEGRCHQGFFIEPTIVTGLGSLCRTNQEEIFGPVVTIMPFDTEQEALEIANGTRYGLSCSLWTQNIGRAHQMAENLETGIVWINTWLLRDLRTPFGGTKDSGVGREGGWEAMRFFTEPKNVCIQYGI